MLGELINHTTEPEPPKDSGITPIVVIGDDTYTKTDTGFYDEKIRSRSFGDTLYEILCNHDYNASDRFNESGCWGSMTKEQLWAEFVKQAQSIKKEA